MSRVKTEKLHDFLVAKEINYNVRLTSFAHGELKSTFLYDCIQREWNESKLVNHILSVYYSIPGNKPTLNKAQIEHFRKILLERQKEEENKLRSQTAIDFDNPITDYIKNNIKFE